MYITLQCFIKQRRYLALRGVCPHNARFIPIDSTRYEKKQIAACKAWEYERNEMQVTLGNVRDDLDFLKDVDTNVAQTRRERK